MFISGFKVSKESLKSQIRLSVLQIALGVRLTRSSFVRKSVKNSFWTNIKYFHLTVDKARSVNYLKDSNKARVGSCSSKILQ